jgi:hypothetical protein
VHDSDLAIWRIFNLDAIKLGFGLWNKAIVAFILECGLLTLALIYYLKRTYPVNKTGKYGPACLLVLLIGIQAGMTFGPYIPMNKSVFATIALGAFLLFTLIAGFLDSNRHGVDQSEL